jgi:hypothetical protein
MECASSLTSCAAIELAERRLRRQEKLNDTYWEAHLISYPNRTKKTSVLLEERGGSEMMFVNYKGKSVRE